MPGPRHSRLAEQKLNSTIPTFHSVQSGALSRARRRADRHLLGEETIGKIQKLVERQRRSHATVYFDSGLDMMLAGDTTGAEKSWRQAIRICPDHCEARVNLCALLQQQGHMKAAEQECREVLQRDPTHADAHCNLGVLLERKGDLKGAEQAYNDALRCNKAHLEAQHDTHLPNRRLSRTGNDFNLPPIRSSQRGSSYCGLISTSGTCSVQSVDGSTGDVRLAAPARPTEVVTPTHTEPCPPSTTPPPHRPTRHTNYSDCSKLPLSSGPSPQPKRPEPAASSVTPSAPCEVAQRSIAPRHRYHIVNCAPSDDP